MAGEVITVAIADQENLIETRPCRVLNLADGTRAALWRGLAWPIGGGDRIDISGPAFQVLEPEAVRAKLFGLVEGVEETWLILDGPATVRDAAAAALRRAGITVLRSGPWLGDPVDGVAGTSFVRFIRPATEDLRQVLADILHDAAAPAPPRPDPADRVTALTAELMTARAELAAADAELAAANAELARSRLAQAQEWAPTSTEAELATARLENVRLFEEVAELRRQLTAPPPPPADMPRRAVRLRDEIEAFATALRPDLRFLRDSMTVLVGEFSDRTAFYREIAQLDRDGLGRLNWKKIEGATGWRERHVSNGQDNSGRLYARRSDKGWDLLVSHKQQQDHDIEWLDSRTTAATGARAKEALGRNR